MNKYLLLIFLTLGTICTPAQDTTLYFTGAAEMRGVKLSGYRQTFIDSAMYFYIEFDKRSITRIFSDPVTEHRTPGAIVSGPKTGAQDFLSNYKANSIGEGVYRVNIPTADHYDDFRMRAEKYFEFVEPDMAYSVVTKTNDTYFQASYHLAKMKAVEGWALIPPGSPKVRVCWIEGGGYQHTGHPDLPAPFAMRNSLALVNDASISSPYDKHPTTTWGAGASIVNNSTGTAGDGNNMIESVLDRIGQNPTPSGSFSTTSSAYVDAFSTAKITGCRIVTVSLGGSSQSAAVQAAINSFVTPTATWPGGIVFASTGNGGMANVIQYPCSYQNVFGVGATGSVDLRSSFSNYGIYCDGSAPGSSIWTTDRTGSDGYSGGDYSQKSGTSYSSPLMACAAALGFCIKPNATSTEMLDFINASFDKVGPYTYKTDGAHPKYTWCPELGYGRFNLYEYLKNVNEDIIIPPDPEPGEYGIEIVGSISYPSTTTVKLTYYLKNSGGRDIATVKKKVDNSTYATQTVNLELGEITANSGITKQRGTAGNFTVTVTQLDGITGLPFWAQKVFTY